MDYKEKYEQALERAKIWQNHLYETNDKDYADELNYIFPELVESEDERIRKWLIGYFQQYRIDGMEVVYANSLKVDDIISWLEKQDKQKTADKIEPKKLDADKVIGWLIRYMPIFWDTPCNPQRIVEQFKEDFEI